jgi:hypothetical protein
VLAVGRNLTNPAFCFAPPATLLCAIPPANGLRTLNTYNMCVLPQSNVISKCIFSNASALSMPRSTAHRRIEQVHHVTSQTTLARLSTTCCPIGQSVSSAGSGGKTSACSVHACPPPTPRRGVVGEQQSRRHLLSSQETISRVSRANRARACKRVDDAVGQGL